MALIGKKIDFNQVMEQLTFARFHRKGNYVDKAGYSKIINIHAELSGKMIFSSIKLKANLEKRIETRQPRYSLIEYMKSDQFEPKNILEIKNLRQNIEIK